MRACLSSVPSMQARRSSFLGAGLCFCFFSAAIEFAAPDMSANAQHAVSHRYIQRCATFSVPPSRAVVGARASCSYLPDSHVRRISNGSGIALPKEFVLLRLLLFLAEIIAKHACIAARARA